MKRSYLAALAIIVAVSAWLLTGLLSSDESTATHRSPASTSANLGVPTVQVRDSVAQPHVRRLSLFGRTEADRTVKIKAETAGRVVGKPVDKGRTVEAGEVLVRLSMDDREAKLRMAEAKVAEAAAVHEASKSLSRSGFRSTISAAESLAALEAARAQLAATKLDIERTAIRAPFAGVIDDFVVDEGAYVDAFEPVGTIVDLDPIVIASEVTERDSRFVREGSRAAVRFASGEQAEGVVKYVARMARDATRTFRVDIEVANPDGAIAHGMTAEVLLPMGAELAHFVSPAILTLDDAGVLGVKAVDAEGRVRFVPAKILDATADGVWIGGLPESATLITVGQEYVRGGQRVQTAPELAETGRGGRS